MIDFNKLRQNKGKGYDQIKQTLQKTERQSYDDPRFWKYTRNSDNKSINIIRFLTVPYVDYVGAEQGKWNEVDLTPMIKILKHRFQGPNGWYIENSLQTFGDPDPISEWTIPQWSKLKDKDDPVIKAKRDDLKKFIPQTEYIANILVIKDGTNPQNNGQVKLFRIPHTLFNMIEAAKNPDPDLTSDPSIDVFDIWEGANLNLNFTFDKRQWQGKDTFIPKWDLVKWGQQSALFDGDEAQIDRVWRESHSLQEFMQRDKFPTYESAKAKFYKVMGLNDEGKPAASGASVSKNAADFLATQPQTAPAPSVPSSAQSSIPSFDDIDPLAEFESLLNS